MKNLELIGAGRTRLVYRHGNYVVKVPLDQRGIDDNMYEREVYRRSRGKDTYVKYARCRLMGVILIMEYAKYPGPRADKNGYIPYGCLPDWAYSVDCGQVGYNRKGEIVAYDYGYH